MNFPYYHTYMPVAYRDEPLSPVPGWGMLPYLAGNRTIAIGELPGVLTQPISDSVWAQLQPMVRIEIDRGVYEAKKTSYILGGIVMASVFASASLAVWLARRR